MINDYFNKYSYGMLYLGKYQVGDVVKIKIALNDDELIFDDGLLYTEDDTCLQNIYNKLKNNAINLQYVNSSTAFFDIFVDKEKDILLTIPYENGWTIMVDDKKIESNSILNGLITFKLDKGLHNVKLSFYPQGLKIGIIISLISLILTMFLIWRETYEKKKRI